MLKAHYHEPNRLQTEKIMNQTISSHSETSKRIQNFRRTSGNIFFYHFILCILCNFGGKTDLLIPKQPANIRARLMTNFTSIYHLSSMLCLFFPSSQYMSPAIMIQSHVPGRSNLITLSRSFAAFRVVIYQQPGNRNPVFWFSPF